jgi:hypothetical protein
MIVLATVKAWTTMKTINRYIPVAFDASFMLVIVAIQDFYFVVYIV